MAFKSSSLSGCARVVNLTLTVSLTEHENLVCKSTFILLSFKVAMEVAEATAEDTEVRSRSIFP